ncbi:hypothetical protein [Caballeronia concitans]|uniref:Uncharacterized protein n=1 Tax=Caballeronia concitans TaxID=1777133 RepID=A0A658QR03_9BURK|nr:hypothetical protein [Caballeronia concitans]SAL12348.1 hypothetical protein AWB72_00413 [Caballeronia concitans]
MTFRFGDWQPSYNTLDVPLKSGWRCTLVPRLQCGTELWFLKGDARKTIQEDRIAFARYFRPNLDLRTIPGGDALRIIQRFLRTFLRVAHWNQPTSNEEIERFFRRAVRDEALIPVVNRGWRLAPRFDVPPDAPQRWPRQVGLQSMPRDPDYIPIRQRGAAASAGSLGSDAVATEPDRGSLIIDSGGGSSSEFDWHDAVENAAGAVLGGSSSDDDSSFAMSLEDGSALEASPFAYSEDQQLGNVLDIAARGVSESDEADCFSLYERDLRMCDVARAMYQDPRSVALCQQRAFENYQACRGY